MALLFWLYGSRPLVAEPWQWADDGLYLRQAEGILRCLNQEGGAWLGPFDALILSKTPLFAVFLSIFQVCGIPLRLAEFAALFSLPFLMRAAVRPIHRLRGLLFAATTILLVALPVIPQQVRMNRSTLAMFLIGACLISAIGLLLRARLGGERQYGWATLTGLCFAGCYLIREETIWLLPVVALALATALVGCRITRQYQEIWKPPLALISTAVLPVLFVSALNYRDYAFFGTTIRRAPGLTHAFQLLTSLEPSTREQYLPIKAATRQKAYAVSPTFARLASHLEGRASDSIAKNPGHHSMNGRPKGGREFFISNFEFVLTEAAFRSGASSAPQMEELFQQMAGELEGAIRAGKIEAGNHGPGLLGPPRPGDLGRIINATGLSLANLYSLKGMGEYGKGNSSGTPADLSRMSMMTLSPYAPTKETAAVVPARPGISWARFIHGKLVWLERIAYFLGTLSILFLIARPILRKRRDWDEIMIAWTGLLLLGALALFATAMGVLHVLGFPALKWGSSYNAIGYMPLAVLSVFGWIGLATTIEKRLRSGTDTPH